VDASHPDYVCHLHKAIYGLKQEPDAWFNHLSQALFEISFQSSKVDISLFIYHTTNATLYVLVYVDDILITGTNKEAIFVVIKQLQAVFAIKDLDDIGVLFGDASTLGLHWVTYSTAQVHHGLITQFDYDRCQTIFCSYSVWFETLSLRW
jgi:hypothetical protein